MTASVTRVCVPYTVPYSAQVASPELAAAFWEEGLDMAADPRWALSGAATRDEYAYWADRACGPACVKMCVEALGGPAQTLMDWVRAGLAVNGYLVRDEADGRRVELGWAHKSLAALLASAGLAAEARAASVGDIVAHLQAGRLVIASVSPEIGTTGPVTRRGGHLVVVIGAELLAGQPAAVIIHNPSGRRPELQASARLPAERFQAAFSGRVIVAQRADPGVPEQAD